MSNVINLADKRAAPRQSGKVIILTDYEEAMAVILTAMEDARELTSDPIALIPIRKAIALLRDCHQFRNPGA